MKFFVELAPPPWKMGNASHFMNLERRLKRQVGFLRELRDKKTIEAGPFAVLNAIAPRAAFIVNTDSWESLSRTLHNDPMFYLQSAEVKYLGDWEEAMAKHADTIGSSHGAHDLEQDVRVDLGLDLPRPRDPVQELLSEQKREIDLLRAEVGTLLAQVGQLSQKK